MHRLQSYLCDEWLDGDGPVSTLVDPSTEAPVAQAATGGIDFARALAHARSEGGRRLRAMTFAERGALLKAMSRALY